MILKTLARLVSKIIINPLQCFFGIKGQVGIDRNQVMRYNTLLLQLIAWDLLSACHSVGAFQSKYSKQLVQSIVNNV